MHHRETYVFDTAAVAHVCVVSGRGGTHQGKTRGLHVILYDGQTYLDTVTSGLRELTGNMVAKYEPELLSFTLFLHFARPHIRQTCARDGRVSREPDVDLSRIRETL